jgi:hypothetical protein
MIFKKSSVHPPGCLSPARCRLGSRSVLHARLFDGSIVRNRFGARVFSLREPLCQSPPSACGKYHPPPAPSPSNRPFLSRNPFPDRQNPLCDSKTPVSTVARHTGGLAPRLSTVKPAALVFQHLFPPSIPTIGHQHPLPDRQILPCAAATPAIPHEIPGLIPISGFLRPANP